MLIRLWATNLTLRPYYLSESHSHGLESISQSAQSFPMAGEHLPVWTVIPHGWRASLSLHSHSHGPENTSQSRLCDSHSMGFEKHLSVQRSTGVSFPNPPPPTPFQATHLGKLPPMRILPRGYSVLPTLTGGLTSRLPKESRPEAPANSISWVTYPKSGP